ncbi:MAG: hypothetical protein LIO97_08775 [Tannerellaceae bacterium]|nr:hypothetical protein [Tannerellaceae bacterium]
MKSQIYTTTINPFYRHNALFRYHELDVTVEATGDIQLNGWLGAVLRNCFLYAAEMIKVEGTTSFRQATEQLLLSATHPLYNQVKTGFPRGYGLTLVSCTSSFIPNV